MKERPDPEQSHQFNRTMLLAMVLAATLAVLLVGLLYGCGKSSRPERQSRPPTPSGRMAQPPQRRVFNIESAAELSLMLHAT